MSRVMMLSIDEKEAQVASKAANILRDFDISLEYVSVSLGNIMENINNIINKINKSKAEVVIVTAGLMPGLPGIIASGTAVPVLSVPVMSGFLNGLDTLISALKAPYECTAPVLAIESGENAGLMAVHILAVHDKELEDKLAKYRQSMRENVEKQNEKLKEELQ